MDSRDYLIELRLGTGMTRKEFCEFSDIPYRTMQDWELGNRKMPDYLLRLMEYKIRIEKLMKAKEEANTENTIGDSTPTTNECITKEKNKTKKRANKPNNN